jgi:hypothetical protein
LHNRCVDCRPGGRWGDTERVVAQWRRSVAFGEALVMLHRAMNTVLHRRTAMAIEMACDGGAFGFYERHEPPPSGDARGIVPAHRDGHQNGQQSGYILHNRCVDCRPGNRRGDTERVVTRWRRSVAFGEALVMLHWAMNRVLHRRTAMAIEMACDGGAFVCCRRLFRLPESQLRTML